MYDKDKDGLYGISHQPSFPVMLFLQGHMEIQGSESLRNHAP